MHVGVFACMYVCVYLLQSDTQERMGGMSVASYGTRINIHAQSPIQKMAVHLCVCPPESVFACICIHVNVQLLGHLARCCSGFCAPLY